MIRSVSGLVTLAVIAGLGPAAPATAAAEPDPRTRRPLFVDRQMVAAHQEPVYRTRIGSRAQAFWVLPELYPRASVRADVRAYTRRALAARRTPVLVVYGIPDRDCGQHSEGGLPGAAAYRAWVDRIAAGLRRQRAMVVLEPDAIPSAGGPGCRNAATRLALLRHATRVLARAGVWVYIDAGHSGWTPYAGRARLLQRAGVRWARGISTNVSNFRATSAERRYARLLLGRLRALGVPGKHFVVDTSRNGARPRTDEVINPRWARVGARPRLVFRGAFDATLWVKHPGESDGPVNGGPAAGAWCDRLADRLLGRPDSGHC